MIKQEVITGFITGLVGLIMGVSIVTLIVSQVKGSSFDHTLDMYMNDGNLWMLICLGSILNLGLFFLMLKKNQDYRARGILLATFLAAFISYVIYFI
ncbi:MAG: hypothetical protein HRT68_14270 [Flavobacteriaceae bacterium]|nr:hypothetical protein [Flavobacteriaceae bacterium]